MDNSNNHPPSDDQNNLNDILARIANKGSSLDKNNTLSSPEIPSLNDSGVMINKLSNPSPKLQPVAKPASMTAIPMTGTGNLMNFMKIGNLNKIDKFSKNSANQAFTATGNTTGLDGLLAKFSEQNLVNKLPIPLSMPNSMINTSCQISNPLSQNTSSQNLANLNKLQNNLLKEKPFRLGSSRSWNGTLYDYTDKEVEKIQALIPSTSQGILGFEYHKNENKNVLRIFCVFRQPWRPARLEKLGSNRAIWQHGRAKDAMVYFKNSYKTQRPGVPGLYLSGPTNKDKFAGPVNKNGMGPNNKEFVMSLFNKGMTPGSSTNNEETGSKGNDLILPDNVAINDWDKEISENSSSSNVNLINKLLSGQSTLNPNSLGNNATASTSNGTPTLEDLDILNLNNSNLEHKGAYTNEERTFTIMPLNSSYAHGSNITSPTQGVIKTFIPDDPNDSGDNNIQIFKKETWDNRNLCRKDKEGNPKHAHKHLLNNNPIIPISMVKHTGSSTLSRKSTPEPFNEVQNNASFSSKTELDLKKLIDTFKKENDTNSCIGLPSEICIFCIFFLQVENQKKTLPFSLLSSNFIANYTDDGNLPPMIHSDDPEQQKLSSNSPVNIKNEYETNDEEVKKINLSRQPSENLSNSNNSSGQASSESLKNNTNTLPNLSHSNMVTPNNASSNGNTSVLTDNNNTQEDNRNCLDLSKLLQNASNNSNNNSSNMNNNPIQNLMNTLTQNNSNNSQPNNSNSNLNTNPLLQQLQELNNQQKQNQLAQQAAMAQQQQQQQHNQQQTLLNLITQNNPNMINSLNLSTQETNSIQNSRTPQKSLSTPLANPSCTLNHNQNSNNNLTSNNTHNNNNNNNSSMHLHTTHLNHSHSTNSVNSNTSSSAHHCIICNEGFNDSIEVQYHIIQKHIGQPVLFERCSICHANIAMECFNDHVKTCHPNYYKLMLQINLHQQNQTNLSPNELLLQNQLIQQQLLNHIATLNQPTTNNNINVTAIQAALNMAGYPNANGLAGAAAVQANHSEDSGKSSSGMLKDSLNSTNSTINQQTTLSRKRKLTNSHQSPSPNHLNNALTNSKLTENFKDILAAVTNSSNNSNNNSNMNAQNSHNNISTPNKKGKFQCHCGTSFEQENNLNAHKLHYCEMSSSNSGSNDLLPSLLNNEVNKTNLLEILRFEVL